jgi:uncharacterized protein YjdB
MKKLLLPILFAVSFFNIGFTQGCVCSQQYPAGAVTPTTVWSDVDACNYAGEYAVINVIAGNIYEFSTCSIYGSNTFYDTELTLLSNQQGFLAYNDDFCGAQSYISWTATYTGTVQIHLTEYIASGCWTNQTCTNIRYRMTLGAVTVPANNLCANATSLTPAANCNLTSGTTIGATEDPYPNPPCDLPGVYNDVWYSFNSGAFTSLNLTVNLGTAALIGVEFYSACGTLATGLSLGGIPGNCDFNTNVPNPTVITGLTPNTTYRMRMFTNASYDTPGTFTTCLTTPPPPTVSVNSTSICAGQSVTLTATPSTAGGTYLWSNGATTPTITVTPNATTNYSVTYSNNGTASGSGTVTVNPAPTINGGQDQTVCAGATVTLNGTGGASYTWDNGISNGVAFVANATTTYTVTGTDANGCTNTDQVTVTVNAAPTLNALNNQTLCAGASASAVTFSGTAGATYAWVNSNPSIGLAASGSGNIAVFTASNATANPITGTITVTPSQAGCTGIPQTFTITVNPNPTITGNNPLCAGATLQLTGSGTAAANNAWASGTPANGTVSNTGLVTGVNAGNTTITYTNANGCTATQPITINANPTITGNTVICPNTTSQLTGSGAPAVNNAWSSSNTAIATVSNTGLVTALSFGTSTITFINNNGCTATTTINVSNPTAPAFNPIAAVCAGGVISLPGASTNNVQGTWSPAVNNTQTTTYTFTPSAGQCATNATLAVNVNPLPTINAGLDQTECQGANVTLSGTGGNSYTWDNGVSNGVAFVPNATTTYTVTGTDANGCSNTDQVTVTVSPNPTLSGNTVICPNTTSQLAANANPAASNAWTTSNAAVATISNTGLVTAVSFGTSTITFTNNNGCTATTTINVSNPTAPAFNPIAAVCAGGVISLPVASTNNIQGTWSPAVNNTQTTTYTFTPSAGQCATNATLTVNVNPLPTINAGLDQTVCQGANVTLSGTGGNSYTWDNGVSNGVAFVPNTTTTYTVTGTDANGCSNTDQVTVTVSPNPTLSGNTVICPNTTSQLSANANPAASNAWTTSNAAVATISNTGLVTALSFGTSTITFTNNNGCTATTTINVTNPIAPTFNPISAVCSGGSITLPAASTNNVQGTWSPAVNNTQTTMYTFTPSAGQCATTAQQTVTVNPNPSISGGGSVCVGSTLQLTGSGTPAVNAPWVSGTAAIGSVSNNGLFTALSPGTSVLTYTNSNGCSSSTTVSVQGPVIASPQQVTACLSHLWNGQTYSQSGTYSDTLQTVAGCDSIISLNLTISDSITGPTTQQNACGPYTWNGQTYTQSGTYTYNGTTANGCDSSATLVLTIDLAPSNVQVSLNQGTFTVSAQNANTFAWMDCATNALIPGETSATFTPIISGSYAAVVSNACGSDTTTCEPIEVQGISETDSELIAVYPNPSAGIYTVASKGSIIQDVVLYSVNGELIWRNAHNSQEITIDLSEYARGTYMLHVSTNQHANVFRLIKQ